MHVYPLQRRQLSANESWLVQFFNVGGQFGEVGGAPASCCIQLRLVELYSHVDAVGLRALKLCHHENHLSAWKAKKHIKEVGNGHHKFGKTAISWYW